MSGPGGEGPSGALGGFPGDVFRKRRGHVLSELARGAMVLPAAPVLVRGADAELPFRTDADLFYLTGFIEPEAVLVLRGFAEEDRSVLFVRPRDTKAERWSGRRLGPEGAQELVGVEAVRSRKGFEKELPALLEGADFVHYRMGVHPDLDRAVVESLRHGRRKGARTGAGPRGVIDPGQILDEMRLRKDPLEVEAIREATRLTVAAFREGLGRIRPGAGEWEVQAWLEATVRGQGGTGPAFATIVASGPNACVLHYIEHTRWIEAGDLVLVDAGAEHRMYGGDVTRTVPASGAFQGAQRAVYEVVEAARRAAVEAIAPGTSVAEVHDRAVRTLAAGLAEMGVLAGSVDDLVREEKHKPYFPHRTSHWLGLETHDVGDYARNGRSRLLEPGMVLTVEPGLYFPLEGDADAPEALRGIGVRIEDDVLVTDTGAEVLTGDLPTAPDEVADLVGKGGA